MVCNNALLLPIIIFTPDHDNIYKMACAPSGDSYQYAHHPCSLTSLQCSNEGTLGHLLSIEHLSTALIKLRRLIWVFAGRTMIHFCGFAVPWRIYFLHNVIEPPYDKTNKWPVRPVWSVFAVRMKNDWVFSYPLSAQRRLWSDWADAQAGLSLRCAHMPFCWFCHVAAQLYSFPHLFYSALIRFVCSFWIANFRFHPYAYTIKYFVFVLIYSVIYVISTIQRNYCFLIYPLKHVEQQNTQGHKNISHFHNLELVLVAITFSKQLESNIYGFSGDIWEKQLCGVSRKYQHDNAF